MYWWRARVGAIVVSDNVVSECDYWRMAPEGVSIHAARMHVVDGAEPVRRLADMAARAEGAAEDLATLSPDVVVYACTSGSFFEGAQWEHDHTTRLSEIVRAPVISTAAACTAALRAHGADRIAVASPYTTEINERLREYYRSAGFSIESLVSIEEHSSFGVHRMSPELIYDMIVESDRPEAQAVFFSCTAVPALDVIDAAERCIGKPVVAANQATFWAALRAAGVRDRLGGFGSLLSAGVDDAALVQRYGRSKRLRTRFGARTMIG